MRVVYRRLGIVPAVLWAVVMLIAACGGTMPRLSGESQTSTAGLLSPVPAVPPEGTTAGGQAPTPVLPLQGTSVRFDRYSLEEGLSQSVAQVLAQDERGFLWIGTEDGLNRFDGYECKVFRHDPEDVNSLSANTITSLSVGQDNALWIASFGGGVDRLDLETERFTHYRHDSNDDNSLGSDQALAVHEDRDGDLWVGTSDGLDRLDPATGQWRRFRNDPHDPNSLSYDGVIAIAEDPAGALWLATGLGLDRLGPDGQWRHYRHDPDRPESIASDAIRALYIDGAGNLWTGTANAGVSRLDTSQAGTREPADLRFEHFRHDPTDPNSPGSDSIGALVEDQAGVIWVGTAIGLDSLDPATGEWRHYRHDPADPYSLGLGSIRALLVDHSGGVWAGAYGGGLNRYDRLREQFAHYKADPGNPEGLSEEPIWAILEDSDGVLWIGSNGQGLHRLDRRTGEVRRYVRDAQDPHSLSSDTIFSLVEDRRGTLWLGTGNGLNRLDPETSEGSAPRFAHYPAEPGDPNAIPRTTIWALLEDRRGKIWLGTELGLYEFDPHTEEVRHFAADPRNTSRLSHNRAWVLYEDRSGVLWVGTPGGLNKLDPLTGRFTRYQHDPEDPGSLSHNSVMSIHEDASGTLWVGTWGGGLNRFDRYTGTFDHFWVKDGLPNDTIYGILEEPGPSLSQAGILWLSTNNGLSRFDPETETFRNFGPGDGLQSAEFDLNAHFQSPSGEMFFGGINGFNAFYPGDVQDNHFVPPLLLTSLTQNGQVVDAEKAAPAITETTVKWPRNGLEFEFAALSYYRPENNEYAYKLEGYDAGWNYVGNRRFSSYTNLPGGAYTLRVKGSNSDGVWNEEGLAIPVTVLPPFWVTWWFRGIIVLAVMGVIAAAYWRRVRNIEGRSHELERQVASRTKELAALNAVTTAVSRSLDLKTVLDDALDKTLEVMNTEAGGIYLLQDEGLHGGDGVLRVAAHRGLSPEHVEGADNLLVGEGFSGQVVQDCEVLVVEDPAIDPRLTRSVVAESGFRTIAIAPLVSRARVLGTLFVMTRDRAQYGEQELDLLMAIGGQIGVAIENARFFEEEQRRAGQFRVMAEVGHRLSLILDLDVLLQQVVSLVKEVFGYYHVALALVEGDEVVYRVGAGRLWEEPDFALTPARLKIGEEGISGWVASSGESLLVPDVRQEPRYVWMEGSETLSELTVPISAKGKIIGVLDAQSNRLSAFDQTDLAVLQTVAHQAGAAIENARLYEQAQQVAVAEERNRLARELHDAVTQTLFSASLIAEAIPATYETDQREGRELLTELRQLTRGALAEMRTLLLELRPASLVEAGLGDLLRQLTEAITGRLGLPVTVQVAGECVLPPEVHVALYRIAQEALNNVVKHARASEVELRLTTLPPCLPGRPPAPGTEVELCVCDDGRGFDPQDVPLDHLGLDIMRERAEAIGADLTIDTRPGKGTEVRAIWVAGVT